MQPPLVALYPPAAWKSELCRTVGFCHCFVSLVHGALWSRGARRGLAGPESLWESRSRAGASARKLRSFFPGTKPRCKQGKLEEGVSSPLSLMSRWPAPQRCRLALLGVPNEGLGEQRHKALPRCPSSPCLAGYRCRGWGAGKNSFDKAASLEPLPLTWQRGSRSAVSASAAPGKARLVPFCWHLDSAASNNET